MSEIINPKRVANCLDCNSIIDNRSKRCRKCYYIARNTNFKAHPNSLKALRPKSKQWMQEHKIHLGHKHSLESIIKISESRKGKALREKNGRWNNGESITSNGYKSRLVKTSSPHKFEHRWVVEKMIGRSLTFNEVVHHIDHDKLNNDISNLQIMSRSEHSTLHGKGLI